ncbi:hypothetical protein NA57DRAFT_80508 [Rhizodiscina lignyota]|uniref:Uncharacterized protein n=1 Tax=Rhizodiscina lignyota TaxID=1504668 RepID=A0A9P4M5R7_9PEZI|nr:hypothetical protein NA57DRAFT_80508 [Rhizodiscina lignyota]
MRIAILTLLSLVAICHAAAIPTSNFNERSIECGPDGNDCEANPNYGGRSRTPVRRDEVEDEVDDEAANARTFGAPPARKRELEKRRCLTLGFDPNSTDPILPPC